ncbi:hypothetical protein BGZ99_007109 [Dissophora globulifera]|uniref:Mitotic checkpoint regulator, MAD2B-interacting-domain-containing protein n=1 Tax=Dissophora globulifera TaxID=979702 RepID=A0A9P6V0Y5_9FUNG|nr:hypothetical protein BGZ99_007109 [Dissophora globulifera]
MDALNAYGSDSEDSGSETISPSTTARTSGTKTTSLNSLLPPPKSNNNSVTAATTSASTAPAAKTSKYYSLPTLEPESDSDEEESIFRKKARLSEAAKNAGSGVSGLFAMLPAPKAKSSSSITTAAAAKAKPSFMPRAVKKNTEAAAAAPKKPAFTTSNEGDDDEAEDDDEPVSFFPLGAAATATSSKGKTASSTYIPLFFDKKPLTTQEQQEQSQPDVDVSTTNEQYAYPSNEQYAFPGNEQYAYNEQYEYPTNDQYAYQTNDVHAAGAHHAYHGQSSGGKEGYSGGNMIELDDTGLKQLGMRKARDIPINVIDVSARDQMNQARHMRQAASGSNSQPKPVDLSTIEHLKPTALLKRKHNIMSLAYEAKANEAQLSASWAASRRTKAETQSKYGF